MKDFSKLQLELETKRLFLRPLENSDAKVIFEYSSNSDVQQYLTWEVKKIEETKKFLKKQKKAFEKGEEITWGIFSNKEFCGIIGLHGIEWEKEACKTKIAELGYWLGKKFWKQGIMTEAAQAVLHFAFKKMNLHKVFAMIFSQNTASRRVIEGLGFRYVGEMRDQYYKNGKWWSDTIYEMLESEFIKKNKST